ncbi:MAG: Stress response protein nst1 [Pleopsidium flavum]|nr:MAG: Stress response protein nst1 [Pleopsidium flavum]
MAQVTQGSTGANGAQTSVNNITADSTNPSVNRKKQKRRQKQAARMAAEQQLSSNLGAEISYGENGHSSYTNVGQNHDPSSSQIAHDDSEYGDPDFDDPQQYEPAEGEDLYYTDDEGRIYRNPYIAGQSSANGHPPNGFISTDKRPKKKKAKARSPPRHEARGDALRGSSSIPPSTLQVPPPPPPPPPLSNAALRSAHSISRDRIWNTSTAEERERIKEFWLSLGEEDRRSLVKVEKEAVLRKMKEQQKHSCSCTVCGRKRTAIEEELEVLYDAYYEELEQYANHTQPRLDDRTPMMPPPRMYGHPMARTPPDRIPPLMNAQNPSRGRIQELADDDDEGDDEEYSEEDDDGEDYSDDEPQEELRGPAADFFNFGNSLTVQGGILTVADDLLKNDGKKFIEMMEQLAERRMQREEEAQYAAAGLGHPSMHGGPNHGPPPDEEEYDDEEDEYDSQEDEEYEEDEMDTMTEEQRMEEGRRMFQIFAARMFEQRVLTAYREKVARERQQKLIEELEEESRLDVQREAKKAKEAQKKKDKKKMQKQAKDEEKAKREAEKGAEEAAARAVEEKKLEEQRQRREEQRKRKEAEKRAQDEERLRKEAEKSRRLQEERDKHAEQERRQREQKEREKKKREEVKRKEREEREAKEKVAKEKKESEDRDRREKEAKAKAEKDSKERAMKEEAVAQKAPQAAKRAPQSSSVPIAPGLHAPHAPIGFQSPLLHIATPAIPKAPTPVRPRQASQQESHASSPMTPHFAPGVSTATSPSNAAQLQNASATTGSSANTVNQKPPLHHPQPISTLPPMGGPSGMPPHSMSGFANAAPAMMNGFPSSHAPMNSGMPHRAPVPHDVPMYPNQPAPIGSHYRGYPPPNNMSFPPGINGMRAMPQGRGTQMDGTPSMPHHGVAPVAPPKISTHYYMPRDTMPTHSHSRQQSASIETPNFEHQIPTSASQTQPIARPAPIQRPASVAPHQRRDDVPPTSKAEIDDLSSHLGSSALLDDTDVPLSSDVSDNRRGSAAPGAARHGRLGFGASPLFTDSIGPSKMENYSLGGQSGSGNTWATPQMPFGTPVMAGGHTWSSPPGAGWSTNNTFGVIGGPNRPNSSRPVTIRLMISQACKQLTANSPAKTGNGFHGVSAVLRQVEQLKPINEAPLHIQEMLDICDTEGNAQNGGGSFTIRDEGPRGIFVRFDADDKTPLSGRGPGEIGSPIQGNSTPAFRPFHPPGGMVAPSGF